MYFKTRGIRPSRLDVLGKEFSSHSGPATLNINLNILGHFTKRNKRLEDSLRNPTVEGRLSPW